MRSQALARKKLRRVEVQSVGPEEGRGVSEGFSSGIRRRFTGGNRGRFRGVSEVGSDGVSEERGLEGVLERFVKGRKGRRAGRGG